MKYLIKSKDRKGKKNLGEIYYIKGERLKINIISPSKKYEEFLNILFIDLCHVINTQFELAELSRRRGSSKGFSSRANKNIKDLYNETLKNFPVLKEEIKSINKLKERKLELKKARFNKNCLTCGISISKYAIRCISCYNKNKKYIRRIKNEKTRM